MTERACFTIGAHNLHDEKGTPTLFADVIVFTEAIPDKIARVIQGTTYRMAICLPQPDLVVVYNTNTIRRDRLHRPRYAKYVDGWALVTPNRGTFTVPLIHRATKRRIRLNAEHRINAAFAPFVRGEPTFRAAKWKSHTAGTLATMHRQDAAGLLVVSAGDDNTPYGVRAYPGFHEVGEHFDRIGSNAELSHLQVLSREGSDHSRIRAVVTERAAAG
jgi:hypothetical protein